MTSPEPPHRPHTRLPIAEVSAEVRFLGADGSVLSEEHRETGEYTWLGTLNPAVAVIEVHTSVRARVAGEGEGASGAPSAHLGQWLNYVLCFVKLPPGTRYMITTTEGLGSAVKSKANLSGGHSSFSAKVRAPLPRRCLEPLPL